MVSPWPESLGDEAEGTENFMHIEPGLVDSSKIVLSYATAAAAGAVALRSVVR